MNRIVLFLGIFIIGTTLVAQQRVTVQSHLRDTGIKKETSHSQIYLTENTQTPWLKNGSSFVSEVKIGETRYDNQSNASIPKKIVHFEDGTIGATWTRSMEEGSFFADRGTGYNYFDGNAWGDWPTERIEDIKVHRPTYAQWGENGEIVVTHAGESGLYLATRENKGTGDWDFSSYPGPAGHEYILWNRMVTGGVDHTALFLLAMTLPSSHGGTSYMGLDGALLYSMSTDGGNSWVYENEILDDMTSADYHGFAGDSYAFAEPRGDVVAFVVGDPWTGLFLMKSTDGGENFTKTDIWEHPYPLWQFGTPADTFYCADGAQSLVIDDDGMVHVAFGINRVSADANATYWYPWVGGIAYWNENMDPFSDNHNALNPYGHPDSELTENVNLIGWTQDINNNGQLEFEDDLGWYYLGLSSMPQLVFRDFDQTLILVYSSVTETYTTGEKNYRHLWARAGFDNGNDWGDFVHLTSDLVHVFDECVYPAVASHVDDYGYLIYQYDQEPGTAVWGGQHPYVNNSIGFIKFPLVYINTTEYEGNSGLQVSQNHPNPAADRTWIKLEVSERTEVRMKVFNMAGQKVLEKTPVQLNSGTHLLGIKTENLKDGIYVYTVTANGTSVTKKMVVKKN